MPKKTIKAKCDYLRILPAELPPPDRDTSGSGVGMEATLKVWHVKMSLQIPTVTGLKMEISKGKG